MWILLRGVWTYLCKIRGVRTAETSSHINKNSLVNKVICKFGPILTLFMEVHKMGHIFARIDEN